MSQTKSCVMCSRKIQRAPTSCEHNWRNRKFCSDQCSNDFTHSEKKRRDENRESIPASLLERDHTGAIRVGHRASWEALGVGISWDKAEAQTHHMRGR
ncbi:hypothetical protein [Asaia astilbis]